MLRIYVLIIVMALFAACATERATDSLAEYEQLQHQGIVESPAPVGGRFAPACHTDGAFEGAPNMDLALAGSQTGIAWTNPLETEYPGVVYPPNITPHEKTGIGLWTDAQISDAILAGIGRHGSRRLRTMPWQGYARLTDDDVEAIVAYLRSIPPVEHRVPAAVSPGRKATKPFVYFGVETGYGIDDRKQIFSLSLE